MNSRQIGIPVGEHEMQAQWVLPEKMNPWGAAVICLHDIMGFTDDIVRVSERLASLGYPVLAPNLYDQPGIKALCVMKTLKAHETGKGYVFDQLDACHQWLLTQPQVPVKQVGMMGFCMSGHFTVLYGARARLTVIAPFYGDVPKHAKNLEGICPTVGGWGKRDMIYGRHGERLEQHLTCLGVRHDIKTYEDAGHSYMNNHDTFAFKHLGKFLPMRAAYDGIAAEDSWQRVETFFAAEFERALT